ncbi:FAD-binding domain-containing protein [Falsiroseomonas tokyonensis]|uniref:FAD-binding domain-containing protein n=1 Tax=Falsiroseomonas tokyonensis TaxID=430521 RepID=A0ABV7BU38_9PROT|nr:FAD-binding domain-containing protein [Falsiroseomonas tokyonensis]MBU8537588.1 deoxyribodipyrimidine photolyase [Falsiroseomonas tokyonensis]
MTIEDFPADRAAALHRLQAFGPRMGHHYARGRNTDLGPGHRADVSRLSPALRHRLVTEAEVVATALRLHGAEAAGKFIEEVFWRSYWKGFLQLRPALWDDYQAELAQDLARLEAEPELRAGYDRAVHGATGIAGFDAWAAELREAHWLHNHARMWFASIWIFTLRLPWTLGADFFLRHLLDGDAASNTLSWRWVAGLHTAGKAYVARAENIARCTGGRFDPAGQLEEDAAPLPFLPPSAPRPLPGLGPLPEGPVALLLHEDDLHPESLLPDGVPDGVKVRAIAGFAVPQARSPLGCAPGVARHAWQALADGLARAGRHFDAPATGLAPEAVAGWAVGHGLPVVTPEAPVGWTAAALEGLGIPLHPIRRDWDAACWPEATRGYFAFRQRIPDWLASLRLSPASA